MAGSAWRRSGWRRRGLRAAVAVVPLLLAACGATGGSGPSTLIGSEAVECAPYARRLTGIQLTGAAWTWWAGSIGRYARSAVPWPGGVLVFRRSDRLPSGHVSVVAQVASAREIRVDQANWVHHRIGRLEPVVDVSPAGDWTAVRVWWDPIHALGTTVYPTYGFVLPAPDSGGPGAPAPDGSPPAASGHPELLSGR